MNAGKWYPYYQMEFDHIKEKEFNVSSWANHSLDYDLLKEEMKKCELICSNCHAARTYLRKKKPITKIKLDIERLLEKLKFLLE